MRLDDAMKASAVMCSLDGDGQLAVIASARRLLPSGNHLLAYILYSTEHTKDEKPSFVSMKNGEFIVDEDIYKEGKIISDQWEPVNLYRSRRGEE